jgi:hypothetical protein
MQEAREEARREDPAERTARNMALEGRREGCRAVSKEGYKV